jgi:calcium channel MID1
MVLSNLTFCDQNAYSVPGNQAKFGNGSIDELKQFYDSYAESNYNNFLKAMMQIQCDTDDDSKYSLVRSCDDCRTAYKNWICFVSIPRCEDFSKTDGFLQPRNINSKFPDGSVLNQTILDQFGSVLAYNSSRRAEIDSFVEPGPYKEVLPCDDLCYDIVQSCPSALSFGCPLPGSIGFNTSYGTRDDGGATTCNYPGSAHFMTSPAPLRSAVSSVFTTLAVAGFTVLFLLL